MAIDFTLCQKIIDSALQEYGLIRRGMPFLWQEKNCWVILIGSGGHEFFQSFAKSPEYNDSSLENPLDQWSARIIGDIKQNLHHDNSPETSINTAYPFDKNPLYPFQQWAMQAEAVSPSPLGILIHPKYGLWHAYRGALLFDDNAITNKPTQKINKTASPCDSCKDKPCLHTCPVNAFTHNHYNTKKCINHLATQQGSTCFASACLARRACPVATQHAYPKQLAEFLLKSFYYRLTNQLA